jgi:uncharacterized protein YjbJ (UPF0337 family)
MQMNWDQIKGNWKAVSGEIKLTWGKLSEDDLTAIAGRRDQLSSLLQVRYGWQKVDTENKVDKFAQGLTTQFEASHAVGWTHRT